MKQTLLLCAASVLAAVAYANPVSDRVNASQGVVNVQQMKGTMSPSHSYGQFGKIMAQKLAASPSGRAVRYAQKAVDRKNINPVMKKAAKASALPDGMLLWESFEGFDGTEGWLPEGWTIVSNGDAELGQEAQWGVEMGGVWGFPDAPDGDFYMSIGFSMDALQQDEWLILPELKLEENDELKFELNTSPLFFYNLELIDWENTEWLGEPEIIGDLTVQIKVDGGEWQQIWSMMEQFSGWSLEDIMTYQQFDTYQVSLAEYANKNVQIAFNYKAADCNTIFLDCVSVGLPSLEGISYLPPFETQYWGFDNSAGWASLNISIAQYPVYGPLVFCNNWNLDADYSWAYHDPITNDWATCDDPDILDVTYYPDYSSEFTRRNNLYYPPVLNATAPGATEGSYQMPVDYMQAGGKSEFMVRLADGNQELMEFGLLPFNLNTDGYGITTIDAPSVGDVALPIFGYNANSDKYWLDYTLNGEEPSEGDEVKMIAILNFIYAPTAPMVVTGVHVNGFGNMADDAEFKIEIIPCDEDYMPLEEAIATATCTFAEMDKLESSLPYFALNIPFKFESPVVLDSSYMAYIVKLSGFNSDKVETFIPLQSMIPNEYLCHGWLEKAIKIDSDEFRTSYSPMAYVEGLYGDCYNGFSINLDAYYPWLECDVDEVEIPADGTPVYVNLGSYYDGSELTLSHPHVAGLIASVEGRYNECILTLSHTEQEVIIDGDLIITAPGVEKTIKLTEVTSSVDTLDADSVNGNVVAVYAIDGTQVARSEAKNGVYIVKYANGKIRKAILK